MFTYREDLAHARMRLEQKEHEKEMEVMRRRQAEEEKV
jgi:hypothetical protein